MIHNCDPCIWKKDLGHSWLHREFKVSPGYVRAFLKTDGWREGSAAESTCCLQRTGVLFPAPNDSSQPAPGDLTPLASVQAPAFTCTCTHAHAQTQAYINKCNKIQRVGKSSGETDFLVTNNEEIPQFVLCSHFSHIF